MKFRRFWQIISAELRHHRADERYQSWMERKKRKGYWRQCCFRWLLVFLSMLCALPGLCHWCHSPRCVTSINLHTWCFMHIWHNKTIGYSFYETIDHFGISPVGRVSAVWEINRLIPRFGSGLARATCPLLDLYSLAPPKQRIGITSEPQCFCVSHSRFWFMITCIF